MTIESIHEFLNISIDFLPRFSQMDIDIDVFVDLPLGM